MKWFGQVQSQTQLAEQGALPAATDGEGWQSIEEGLQHLEITLQSLKERYTQVQSDLQTQSDLQAQLQQAGLSEEELHRLEHRLEDLETALESRLLSWRELQEPFWQILRYMGVGVLLGWFLAFAVMRQPQPQPTSGLEQPISQEA